MHRIYLAFQCFFRVLFGKPLPAEVAPPARAPELAPKEPPPALPAPTPEAKPAKPARTERAIVEGGALQVLGLLQREGRLVDFLQEEIETYDDAAIGAAVRDIHRGCRKVLAEHFQLRPVLDSAENEQVTVDEGFDPGRVRLTGNVTGKPPFQGVLRHRGWRVAEVTLPVVSDGVDQAVVAPAEVEL
jgi:hypothetical protein